MRYINVSKIKEGMLLGQDIFDTNGFLLLRRGQPLHRTYIDRLHKIGINGLYIEDELTDDIKITPVVKPETRMNAVKNIRTMYLKAASNWGETDDVVDEAVAAVQHIADEIFFCAKPIYDIYEFKTEKDYRYYHTINMTTIAMIIGTGLNMKKQELRMLGICAAFCDIGLNNYDQELLESSNSLSEEEINAIKNHPVTGFSMLSEKRGIHARIRQGVLHHHERWNGTGYPGHLKGDQISLFARIIAIADVYDALISNRPYRPAVMPYEAFEYIMANGGILFDPDIVKVFTRKVAAFPVGTKIMLSNGNKGYVKFNYSDCALRPVVKVFDRKEMKIIDLKNDPGALNLTIQSAAE